MSSTSPRRSTGHSLETDPHDSIERDRKALARRTPFANPLEPQDPVTQHTGIEILMRDGIPPAVQIIQSVESADVAGIDGPDIIPKSDSETIEVRADVARIRVSRIQLATPDQGLP